MQDLQALIIYVLSIEQGCSNLLDVQAINSHDGATASNSQASLLLFFGPCANAHLATGSKCPQVPRACSYITARKVEIAS